MTIYFGPQCTCGSCYYGAPPVCPVHEYSRYFDRTWTTSITTGKCKGRHCKHDQRCVGYQVWNGLSLSEHP